MRIYLIEENELVNHTIHAFLTDRGHEVMAVSTVETLLTGGLQGKRMVDLVVVGVSCADSSAVRLLRKVHAWYPAVPVVVMTEGGSLSGVEAMAYGVYAYVRKPVRLVELELVILRMEDRGMKIVDPTAGSLEDAVDEIT